MTGAEEDHGDLQGEVPSICGSGQDVAGRKVAFQKAPSEEDRGVLQRPRGISLSAGSSWLGQVQAATKKHLWRPNIPWASSFNKHTTINIIAIIYIYTGNNENI